MIGLLDLIDEHPEAVAYDMIRVGSRLRDFPSPDLTWGDLLTMVRWAQPDTAIYKAVNPHWQQTPELELLRAMEHTLRVLAWQKTEAGSKGRDVPEPVPFPWDAPPSRENDSVSWDEAAHLLGWEAEMARFFEDN